jgi:hypothetical protein
VLVSAPVPQEGTEVLAIKKLTVTVSKLGFAGGYALYEGSVETGTRTTGSVTVDVVEGRSQIVDKILIG